MEPSCSKIVFTWSRDATDALIDLYEMHPCLFLTTSTKYKNKSFRNQAMETIKDRLNEKLLTQLTIKEIQTKIHGLRSQYLNELQKIKKSKVSGMSADNIYKPKWQYFEKLSFIGSHQLITSQGESNLAEQTTQFLETTEEEEGEAEIIFDGHVESMSPSGTMEEEIREEVMSRASSSCSEPQPKKRRMVTTPKRDSALLSSKLLETATRALDGIAGPTPIPNSNAAFGHMISLEMDKIINEDILDELKVNIMQLVFEAKRSSRN